MKEDIAIKWAEALESGEYTQGHDRLRARDTFCCLGVLCDISGLGRWEEDPYRGAVYVISNESAEFSVLPTEVQEWAGLRDFDPILNDDASATTINDSHYWSFIEIAELVKENWETI